MNTYELIYAGQGGSTLNFYFQYQVKYFLNIYDLI